MPVARVTDITAASKKGFDDAIKIGVERAWIQDQKVVVKNGKIVEFRVNMKATFILMD